MPAGYECTWVDRSRRERGAQARPAIVRRTSPLETVHDSLKLANLSFDTLGAVKWFGLEVGDWATWVASIAAVMTLALLAVSNISERRKAKRAVQLQYAAEDRISRALEVITQHLEEQRLADERRREHERQAAERLREAQELSIAQLTASQEESLARQEGPQPELQAPPSPQPERAIDPTQSRARAANHVDLTLDMFDFYLGRTEHEIRKQDQARLTEQVQGILRGEAEPEAAPVEDS